MSVFRKETNECGYIQDTKHPQYHVKLIRKIDDKCFAFIGHSYTILDILRNQVTL